MKPVAPSAPRPLSSLGSETDSVVAGSAVKPVPADAAVAPQAPRLLDRVREGIRVRHYSIRTEAAYVDWVRRFLRFHGRRHPREMGAAEVTAFLTALAVERGVSASTPAQARAALLFLYAQVLRIELPWLDEVVSAKTQRRLPVVLMPGEAAPRERAAA